MPSAFNIQSFFAAFFLYLISANSFASDLFDMLKRMSDADRSQNYQGTFVLRKSDNLSTLRVTHGVDENGVWESLEALNGESRKVVRHNNQVISVFPERELVTIRRTDKKQSLHQQLPKNIDQLGLLYTINRLEDDRIANRQTLVVDLIPKDQYRYGYRYWIDNNTGILLRCDLLAENSTIVEQMMFTSLEYLTETPSQEFGLQHFEQFEQRVLDEPEIDVKHDASMMWAINRLPVGFLLKQSTMRYSQPAIIHKEDTLEKIPPDLLHMVYSDGLASVSVFIEKNLGEDKHLQGPSSMGAVNAFGSPLDEYFATVVGEVPVITVQSMAESLVKLDK